MKKTFSCFSDNLKLIRGFQSQAEFANFLGIPNQVTYHRYENGRVPKAHVLQQIAVRLGTTVDELLSPISIERASSLFIRSMVNAILPKAQTDKLAGGTVKAFAEASGELVNPKSLKAIADAFHLQDLPYDELSPFFHHVVSTANRAPTELMKFYVLIRVAVGRELARRWEKVGPK